MVRVFLGIGSNMGNRKNNIKKAISLLAESKVSVKKVSTLVETEPEGGVIQRRFLNAAIEVETSLKPTDLLKSLKSIERKLGRRKTITNGPRPIDLDILLYGEKKIRRNNLIIPHPKMKERSFVINPLKEIAPEVAREITAHENS